MKTKVTNPTDTKTSMYLAMTNNNIKLTDVDKIQNIHLTRVIWETHTSSSATVAKDGGMQQVIATSSRSAWNAQGRIAPTLTKNSETLRRHVQTGDPPANSVICPTYLAKLNSIQMQKQSRCRDASPIRYREARNQRLAIDYTIRYAMTRALSSGKPEPEIIMEKICKLAGCPKIIIHWTIIIMGIKSNFTSYHP